jgi:type IV pilus assembly protein PilB
MKKEKKKIGELLLEAGLITEHQLKSSLVSQEEWGGRLGSILLRKGFVSEQEMASIIGKQYDMPCASLAEIERPSEEIMNTTRLDIAKRFGIFPLGFEGKTLSVATSDPTDLKTLDDLSFTLGVRIKPVLALESEITRAIETNYEGKFKQGKFVIKRVIAPARLAQMGAVGAERDLAEKRFEGAQEVEREERVPAKSRAEISQKVVIQSIVDLLIAKGVFTREEFMTQLKSKMKQ